MRPLVVSITLLVLNAVPLLGYAETWNVGNDFSPITNPTGAWSYGWRDNPGDPLVLYVDHSNVDEWGTCALDVWYTPPGSWSPEVWHNPHDYTLWCGPNHSTENPPNSVHFHPGTVEESVVRWTAPRDMQVTVSAAFTAIDGGSSRVHVYHNGTELFAADIVGYDDMVLFNQVMQVLGGDVVDCDVSAISYLYDTVRVDITLESAEPSPVKETTWGAAKALYRRP
jgi:hypothetical protein